MFVTQYTVTITQIYTLQAEQAMFLYICKINVFDCVRINADSVIMFILQFV